MMIPVVLLVLGQQLRMKVIPWVWAKERVPKPAFHPAGGHVVRGRNVWVEARAWFKTRWCVGSRR